MKKYIYLVCQTQPSAGYYETPIYALTSEKKAKRYCQMLNKKYAQYAELDDKGNFIGEYQGSDFNLDCVHYYTVQPIKINEPLAENFF